MSSEGTLLGARQLNYLAKSYLLNIALFLSGLVAIDAAGLGLRYGLQPVWIALSAFQLLRLVQFGGRAVALKLLRPA